MDIDKADAFAKLNEIKHRLEELSNRLSASVDAFKEKIDDTARERRKGANDNSA